MKGQTWNSNISGEKRCFGCNSHSHRSDWHENFPDKFWYVSIWITCWESVRTKGTKDEILLEIAWHIFHVQSCSLEKKSLKICNFRWLCFPISNVMTTALLWVIAIETAAHSRIPGKSHGQQRLVATVHSITKSWTWLSHWAQHSSIYSLWLGNPRALEPSGLRGMPPYTFLCRRYEMDIGSCDSINLSGWFWCSFRSHIHSLKVFQSYGTSFTMRVFKKTDLTWLLSSRSAYGCFLIFLLSGFNYPLQASPSKHFTKLLLPGHTLLFDVAQFLHTCLCSSEANIAQVKLLLNIHPLIILLLYQTWLCVFPWSTDAF